MHSLDIEQLKTFLAIVETRNFTRAAERVNKTQSAVSMQMKKLEDVVSKQLFIREGRGISVSPDGHRLISYALDIVEKSNEAITAFDDNALEGSVYLGTADDYAERFLPTVLAGFSQSNPLVDVNVVCENTFGLRQRIKAGELDAAIGTHNEVPNEPGARSELIRREPLLWVTSARHNIHTQTPLPLALGSPHCIWRKSAFEALKAQGRDHRILYTSFSATVVGSAVLAGLAVSVQPESALRPGMRALGAENGFPPLPECEIGLLRGTREKTPATEALVSHIKRSLEAMPMRPFADAPPPLVSLEAIAWPMRNARKRASFG
ncbi:MAG: LysR substrate-binding domain-containing protein [Rhizobiaceae bacterium]